VLCSLALAPLVAAGGGVAWRSWRTQPGPAGPALALRERRPTLDPAHFTGKARTAHEVAREIPDVLDQLRCYCRCEGIGHVSLLSCYTDGHAAT
jgi:hypothetical protein